jgi:hypothetical protein
MRFRREWLVASALAALLTVVLTWPQALHPGTRVVEHIDPFFSMWRLEWIAHALRTDPRHLFNANILYPAPRTLAYSDAALVQGLLAAPLLWAGVGPVLVYNLLLFVGIAGSGLGMFVLARALTGNTSAALVGAAIFTLLPYRVAHAMHLELQWTMWLPLTLWAIHRAVEEGAWRFGALAGLLIALQMLSCVYYGVFLVITAVMLGVGLAATEPRRAVKGLATLALGAVVALALTWPYALPYLDNARALGPRDTAAFSARLVSYVTAPRGNWIWGWTSGRFPGDELHLAPGLVSVVLAIVGLTWRPRRIPALYLVICALSVELSLGLNSYLFTWLSSHMTPLGDLRALARFSIIAFTSMSVLAAFGVDRLQQRLSSRRARHWLCAAIIVLVAVESSSAPIPLTAVQSNTPDVYRVLSSKGPGVVLELPVPYFDPWYEYWSAAHWKPLVNGYSGYISQSYSRTIDSLAEFPDDQSLGRLKRLNVRYILVHRAFYKTRESYIDMVLRMGNRPELIPLGQFKDWIDDTALFEMR